MTDQLLTADFESVNHAIPFKIFSGLLRAYTDDMGRKILHGVASSTVKDRHGDTMERSAIADMERAANENLTIFLNHSYDVPEDVAGSVTKAVAIQRGMDDSGSEIWDLDFDIAVNSKNDRAVKAWEAIDEGTKLGLSIGAMIPEGGALRNKKDGTYKFQHVDLLETSIVGIPANPRSWVQNAIKSLHSMPVMHEYQGGALTGIHQLGTTKMELGAPTITLEDDGSYEIKGKLAEGAIRLSTPEGEFGIENVQVAEAAQCGADMGDGKTCKKPKGHDGPHSSDSETGQNNQSTEPDDPHQDDVDDHEDELTETPGDAEPDESKAKIQVITIDTDDPDGDSGGSQGASGSDPGTEPDDDVYDSAQPQDVSLSSTLSATLESFEATARELVETRRQLLEAQEERDAARRESEQSAEMALKVLEETSVVIEKLAALPVGRKAVVREAVSSVSAIERAYGPEIAKLLGRQ